MREITGLYTKQDVKVAIIASRFNSLITNELIGGAQDALVRHGVADEDITLIWVPGAFEIPAVAKKIAASGEYDGVVTLGAVIRGETAHYDLVINETAKGIGQVALDSNIPVVFGVVTTDTLEQAQQRAGAKAGNKGGEVATALLEMMSLADQI
ncbi:6,7-dimethyl-8-ribityllumazine synthase [Periweissella fabaria]|uniref:6,7-dimethyl-8-ribityllumazine synthase n=1 Tax=Periweissella fabaria TaxID=546157 RepID=A0ABN8BIL0_9LACO|nr:6,7-dimethyl-8-ribityllumazine synthase [Periweissella fabaria]MCM0596556.1 6,7-dimethyl-8-ribityllumazine synthase [Periweissella fabaria]CAH0415715.1 6,7-dimethyl-8-ribityllumazine synthase [Periweissella fabaria]